MTGIKETPLAIDRSQPPTAKPAKRFQLAPFDRTRFGDLEILVLPRTTVPIVSLSIIATKAGADRQPQQRAGIAALTGSALIEGTTSMPAVEFQTRAESLGGFVSAGADWEATAVHAGSLSEHLEQTFALAADAYANPAFRSNDIERLLSRRSSELARRAEDPGSIAGAEFIRRLYGSTRRYGTPLIGDQVSLDRLNEDEVSQHWETRHPDTALVVAGDVTADQVESLARDYLPQFFEGGERSVPSAADDAESPSPPRGIEVCIVDRPKAAQTQLLMGHVGPGRLHEDRAKLRVLNAVFGGKFSSRINLNLREEHGYTYGANSSFSGRRGPGPFAVQAAVENEFVGKAAEQVLLELNRIRTEPIDTIELDDTKSYLLGVQPYGFQSLEGWVSALATLSVFDLSAEWYSQQQEAVASVEVDDVLKAAQAHLHPDHITVVAVGPAAQLADQFEAFESVEVKEQPGSLEAI